MTRSLRRQAGVPSVRCAATAKSTGRRCGRFACPGTTVCPSHLGLAAHVTRKADERMTLAQVMQHDPRPLGEVLLDATHVADSLMRDLRTQVLDGGDPVDPDLLTRLVEATRLAHHLAETAVRAGVQVALVREAQVSREATATLVTTALGAALDAASRALAGAGVPDDALQAARVAAHGAVGDVLRAAEEPAARADLRRSALRELEGGREP